MMSRGVSRLQSLKLVGASRSSSSTFLQSYRPKWPHPDFTSNNEPIPTFPAKTIPEEKLRFKMSAIMEKGTSIFYSHLQSHPGSLRVRLYVKVDELELTPQERKVLIAMVGTRFNPGKKEIKLTADRFPNRVENKRYLAIQLEKLVSEAKRLAKEQPLIG